MAVDLKDLQIKKDAPSIFQQANQNLEQVATDGLKIGMQGLQWFGDRMEDIDKSVNLRNITGIPSEQDYKSAGMTPPPEPKWQSDILDYSFHDARGHLAGGVGNVAGAGSRLLGADPQTSEKINDVAETIAQVVIPQTADLALGAGYYKRLLIKSPKLARLAIKAADEGNTKAWRSLGNALNPELAIAGMPGITTRNVDELANLGSVLKIDKGGAAAGGGLAIRGGVRQEKKGIATDPYSKRRGTATQYTELGEDLSASTHHIRDIGVTGDAYKVHPQGDRLRTRMFAQGEETGESIYNYMTGYDTLLNKAYIAKKNNLMKIYPGLDERSAKDLLKLPKDITRKTKLTQKEIGEHGKILKGVNVSIAPPVKPGEFPPIRNNKGEVIFQATTQKEWDRRFRIVGDKLGLKNTDTLPGQVNTMISNVNADTSLNIFSQDHITYFHDNYKLLESEQLLRSKIADGSFAKLHIDKAEELLLNNLKDKRAIVVNYSRMKTRALLKKYPKLRTMTADQITDFQKTHPQDFAAGIRRQGYNPSFEKLKVRDTAILTDPLGELTSKIFGIRDRPKPVSQMTITAK